MRLYFARRVRGNKRSEHTHVQGSFVNRHFLLCSLVTSESGPSPSASPGAPTLWTEVIIQGPLSEAPVTVEGLSTRNKVPRLPGELTATKTNSFSQVSRSDSILPVTVLSLDIRTRIFQSSSSFPEHFLLFQVTHRVASLEEGKETGYSTTSLLKTVVKVRIYSSQFSHNCCPVWMFYIGQCPLSKTLLTETCTNFRTFVPHPLSPDWLDLY